MWTALSVMIVIWAGMRRVSSTYWNAVDALTERFLKYKENLSPADRFVSA